MKRLLYWAKDYVHMTRHGLAMYFYAKPPQQYMDYVVAGKCPIIILPGILSRWAFMKPLADTLSRAGHPVYVVPALGNNLLHIEESARIVRALIDEHAIRGAIIVAHSKGGLIGKQYMEFYNEDERVVGMVSLATPYTGSAMARIVPHKAFVELDPNSKAVAQLRSHTKANGRIISLIPEFDNHVWAEKGSWLAGAFDNIVLPVQGHHAIVFSRYAEAVVQQSIDRLVAVR
ncbi:MAG: acetyltransferase and hydrolase with the alpha/beta hydrolase fold protein [Candidatus Wolfebacteria bacterium GW2011_GWC2_39_22]|uniref:Acetyltransferase and hydrolase with the alpha/beta hydrolase fold protein n=1 Tax=Candidatus Wolfebacteria bacterium GW2011_GWC2_39_22 TaxID=1619013 RepID=A0A0G0N941_9BACT|nr:MAG: acetyltransferase and hydrolase with the alpha/beta hydrolase fold protein [Candidatus Wolfebacteria bacterium GW2011_GWC2_39_22]HBI25662.1 alpha/beta hydrolase [Candidatus Wolfebacteria bacterium]